MTSKQKAESNELTLLLVGNAGNGKSATGNSILRQQAFQTTASTSSTTRDIAFASGSFEDLKIKIVDVPSVDTNENEEEILNLNIKNIEQALEMCGNRFSALVIVLKCGARFTKEESYFIKTIKGILGTNVITEYGVCILTHGDNFEADNEDENVSFKEWCEKQEGEIKDLFQECNYRCVLFNNRTKDSNLKELQISELLSKVRRDDYYNEDDFKAADADLQKMFMQIKASKLSKVAHEFIQSKRRDIANFQSSVDVEEDIRFYNTIQRDVVNKEMSLRRKYEKVDSIDQYLYSMAVFKMEINSTIRNLNEKQQTEQVKPDSYRAKTPTELDKPRSTNRNYPISTSSWQPQKPAESESSSRQQITTEPRNTSYSRSQNVTEPVNSSSSRQRKATGPRNPSYSRTKYPTEETKLNPSESEKDSTCCSII